MSLLISAQPTIPPAILNYPTDRVYFQIKDDYQRLKAILETVPHSDLKDLEIEFVEPEHRSCVQRFPEDCSEHKCTKKYKIYTENSRGVWVHELAHYFSYHYTGVDGPAEYICQVLAHEINGTLPETIKKNFKYKPFGNSK